MATLHLLDLKEFACSRHVTLCEKTAPDTFALTRVASLLYTGKSVAEIFARRVISHATFVGLTSIFICFLRDSSVSSRFLSLTEES